ncbi:MAG: flagellar biosynthetic protein FliR [Gammaproteobacteria bacterium]|nr:MAG: flagellar biosynthetic protein FliR [Gammaproteobacteria bacterium]
MMIAEDEFVQWIAYFFLPFFRVAAFLMAVPVVGSRLIPVRVRLIMALLVTLSLVQLLPRFDTGDPLKMLSIPLIFEQMVIGLALGFSVQLFIQVGVVAGQIIAMQIGLGFSQLLDPVNGVNVASVSQLFLMLFTLLYLVMNGHLITLEILVDSFRTLPIGAEFSLLNSYWHVANLGSWMFFSAVQIALPAIMALYVVNLTFGIMSKSSPQLQIFSIGFPFTMIYGLVILWVVIGGVLPRYELLFDELLAWMVLINEP